MAAAAVQAPADALVDEGGVPVPPQYKPQPLYDFRQFPEEARGFKVGVTKLGRLGTKRKLDEYAEQVREGLAAIFCSGGTDMHAASGGGGGRRHGTLQLQAVPALPPLACVAAACRSLLPGACLLRVGPSAACSPADPSAARPPSRLPHLPDPHSLLICPTPRLQVEREQAEMEEKSPAELAAAVAVAAAPLAKRAKHNTLGVGKASGRDWKVPAQRAGTLRNPKLSTSWEKKMANKAEADAFKGRKRAAKAAKGEAAAAERQRREAAKKKKEEARAKAAVVTRVSAATAKRMMKSKKGRKQLRTGDA